MMAAGDVGAGPGTAVTSCCAHLACLSWVLPERAPGVANTGHQTGAATCSSHKLSSEIVQKSLQLFLSCIIESS